MKIPYVNIAAQHAQIKEEILNSVSKVISSGQFVLGNEVNEFERRFAEMCGARFALGVNSGTDAIILALMALSIGPGDEVITVPNSFITSASAVAFVGAKPVFVDVGEDYNINPADIEEKITPNTKAILPVHLTGRPADMDAILEIAKRHGLFIIEDCAQAVCAEYKGKQVGTFGDVGCFSLHPLKTLNACGDGGVLTTNSDELYESLSILRNNGLKSRDECKYWSFNSRLDNIQAAILLIKLKYLEKWTEKRRENARFYQEKLKEHPHIQIPVDKLYEKAVYHTFVVQAEQRDRLKEKLEQSGIGTSIHYPVPIHLQKPARELG
ncbi:DegT/DnrJ/EryC1/StrS family aminotransferase, partial [bacterium]|nr:DegT/DnrJ/EryC1/StrS family aminotransferase [bacterium]